MNRNAIKKLALVMFVVLLAAWGSNDPLPQREQGISNFFKKLGASGSNPDYGVVKVGATGVANPTIAVYGYLSNRDVCQEIADYFNQTERGSLAGAYHCEALN